MSADTFLQHLTQVLFVVIFVVVLARTIARPRRSNVDATLLFGATAFIIAETWVTEAANVKPGPLLNVTTSTLLIALPYLLLRLVDDFAGVSKKVLRAAEAALAASVVLLLFWLPAGKQLPAAPSLLIVLYFAVLSLYDAVRFVTAARHGNGITRRRLRAIAAGTLGLGLIIVLAGVEVAWPQSPRWLWGVIADCLALVCVAAYFVGFTPPGWLRRAWQEPELRDFLGRAAALPRLPSTLAIVQELERGAASALGADTAVVGLWDETSGRLEMHSLATQLPPDEVAATAAGQAYFEQRPIFSEDAAHDNPGLETVYQQHRVKAILAVPITTGDRRLGFLAAYAARSPIFAEDDLQLAGLLADQAAVILESRALIDEAARVQAREEATRLKDDFLSAAAHDLKTPLTAIIAQAQLLELRSRRDPSAPADPAGIERLIRESRRLNRLVADLLDISRVEKGKLLGPREDVDLAQLASEACERHVSPQHECRVLAEAPAIGHVDPIRIAQLLDNLLDNAVKYSPGGGAVTIAVRHDGDRAHLTVSDQGIGIPAEDVPLLFDRFHRGSNVDDRRFAGMGLGLFICKGIAEQHGGRLWATSEGPGKGSSFHLELPLIGGTSERTDGAPATSLVSSIPTAGAGG
ncbi:MAG TPA: ATP-binding protein [Chloroflexota bacterium]|nr:ATP-binding protein [Chloroflexota bacterium]